MKYRNVVLILFLFSLFACQETTNLSPIATVEMLKIPAGTFKMGSEARDADERPVRMITISKPFYLAKFEVTNALWKTVMNDNTPNDSLPASGISWFDAVKFCNALSEKQGLRLCYTIRDSAVTWDKSANGFRLPTEAEWEYACRAGTTSDYYTGGFPNTDIDSSYGKAGWYCQNSSGQTHVVGKKLSNTFGLFDMHGNVWEWCWDWFSWYPEGAATDWVVSANPDDKRHIQRGGSYMCMGKSHYGRSSHRHVTLPETKDADFGFRVARSAE